MGFLFELNFINIFTAFFATYVTYLVASYEAIEPIEVKGRLIGLMGIKRSGKDTCADQLVINGFVKKSFADPLKEACKAMFMLTDEQLYGNLKEVPDNRWFGASPRKMLQYVGTELFRDQLNVIMPGLEKNIFTHHFKLWREANPHIDVVVPDVRFTNEVDLIHSLGGTVLKIDRKSVITDDMHASERELMSISNYDHLIDNNGTLENLISCELPRVLMEVMSS